MGHVFISYSRAEFHAAEAVTAIINQSGRARAWLDVQHLRPGTDWASHIDTALDTADALVLLASPAALGSRYVQAELARAREVGIPVHVAVVRSVGLPAELAGCPTHDLRTRFWSAGHRLAAELSGERQRPPAPVRRWALPPFPILLLTALMCVGIAVASSVALLAWRSASLYSGDPEPGSTGRAAAIHIRYVDFLHALGVCNLVVVAGLVAILVRLYLRRATPSGLRESLAALEMVMTFNLITAGLTLDPGSAALDVAAMVAAGLGAWLVSRSRSIHLWIPTGEGAHHVRELIVGRKMPRVRASRLNYAYLWGRYRPRLDELRGVLGGTRYDIVHEAADKRIADLLAGGYDLAGLTRVTAGDTTGDRWTFVLVSAYTDWSKLVTDQHGHGGRTVYVLASSVVPPRGIDADTELIRRSQWLDFRDQSPATLTGFLRSVVSAEPDVSAPPAVPASMTRFQGPRYLTTFLRWAQMLTGLTVSVPLSLLIGSSSPLPLTVITLLLVIVTLRLAWRTATRRISHDSWTLRALLVAAAVIGWAFLIPATSVPLAQIVLVGANVVVVPLVLFSLRTYGRYLQLWLPVDRPARGSGLTPVAPGMLWFPLLATVAAFTAGRILIAPLP